LFLSADGTESKSATFLIAGRWIGVPCIALLMGMDVIRNNGVLNQMI